MIVGGAPGSDLDFGLQWFCIGVFDYHRVGPDGHVLAGEGRFTEGFAGVDDLCPGGAGVHRQRAAGRECVASGWHDEIGGDAEQGQADDHEQDLPAGADGVDLACAEAAVAAPEDGQLLLVDPVAFGNCAIAVGLGLA